MATKGTVGFFATCLINTMRPRIGFACVKLIEEAGFAVEVPMEQTCCGQISYNAGDREATRETARHFLKTFEDYDYIVAGSGSCMGMVKEHYPRLFNEGDRELVGFKNLGEKTFEISQFLVDVARADITPPKTPMKVTYHDSCSGLRELGIKDGPRALLQKVEGLELVEMEASDVCCGFGGAFSVKYPDVSGEMVRKKVASAAATEADAIVSGDLGCILNMEGRAKREGRDLAVYHFTEILAGMVGE